jgi:hypothetical protein
MLEDAYQAEGWLRGKEVKVPRSHVYHNLLSDEINSKIQSVLNTEGTHAYFKACLISIHSTEDGKASPVFKMLIQRSIISIISVIDTTVAYILQTRPDLRKTVKIDPIMPTSLKVCYDKNLKSLENSGYM